MPGKVLIIDDIATNRVTLKVKLAAACYSVAQANTAQDGLESARAIRPDLILCPARLPDCAPGDFVRALRQDPALAETPVVVITAERDAQTRLALFDAGVDDILFKPVEDDVLLARLRSLLRRRETAEELRLREGARHALGLAEPSDSFDGPGNVMLVAATREAAADWCAELRPYMPDRLVPLASDEVMRRISDDDSPDVIALALSGDAPAPGLRLLADLASQPGTRDTGVLVSLSAPSPGLLAETFDRGATDVLDDDAPAREVALRLRRQLQRKRRIDALRATMRDGLRAAVIDPLTGLYNRRYAMPRLARFADEAANTGGDYAVMVVDIDHFKLVNDRLGHAAGDAVLAQMGTLLQSVMHENDLVARIGGEEFLVAMPDTGPDAAHLAARRLCRTIAATGFDLPGQPRPIRITVSIGVALASDPIEPGAAQATSGHAAPEAVLGRADRALYGSKTQGRNKVTLCAHRPAA